MPQNANMVVKGDDFIDVVARNIQNPNLVTRVRTTKAVYDQYLLTRDATQFQSPGWVIESWQSFANYSGSAMQPGDVCIRNDLMPETIIEYMYPASLEPEAGQIIHIAVVGEYTLSNGKVSFDLRVRDGLAADAPLGELVSNQWR